MIVGRRIADELELPINVIPDEERCIVVVQGGADLTNGAPAMLNSDPSSILN